MEILVVFKTHLDLGYIDLAANIEKRYMDEFISHAIGLAEKMKDSDEGFIWTTGSWLITRYLESSEENRVRMERAIREGLISWHALPFTMHVEMMSAGLYEYGLSLSKKLDERFGRRTIAAKCTDVPGFTRAAVPLLAKAGVKLIHVGVNPASAVPDVPPIFRWRAPDGSEIIVIYDKTYGETIRLPGTDKLLCFAMTNDNCGPQDPESLREFYAELHAQYPGAVIRAATLNDAAEALCAANPELPVVTDEIGDSWAHGYQSDPYKQSTFRVMLRYAEALPKEARDRAYDELLKVAEHTCGVCGKTYLDDDGNYSRPDFELARKKPNYRFCERSWLEQREYVTKAADALPPDLNDGALRVIDGCRPVYSGSNDETLRFGEQFRLGEFALSVGHDGAIYGIERGDTVIAPKYCRLFGFEYELFSRADTLRFAEQYLKTKPSWAFDDFTKRGLEDTDASHILAGARAEKLFRRRGSVVCVMSCEPVLNEKYGCPRKLTMTLTAENERLHVDFAWFDKPALRIPEGMWLTFDNPGSGIAVRKLGEWIDPCKVVLRGGNLHGTDFGIRLGAMTVETLDCALCTFGGGLWNFDNRLPSPQSGARFNLCNNQWNTNFPFWYGEDSLFRFVIC